MARRAPASSTSEVTGVPRMQTEIANNIHCNNKNWSQTQDTNRIVDDKTHRITQPREFPDIRR